MIEFDFIYRFLRETEASPGERDEIPAREAVSQAARDLASATAAFG